MPTAQAAPPTSSSSRPTVSAAAAAAALVALYGWAEMALLDRLTRLLRATPATQVGVGIIVTAARRAALQVVRHLEAQTPQLVAALIAAEAAGGQAHAGHAIELSGHGGSGRGGDSSGGAPPPPGSPSIWQAGEDPFDLSLDHGERAARAIEADLVSSLEDVRRRITRLPDDIYKAIAPHAGIRQVLDNNITAEQAQSMAWRVFVSQGVTGFTDRSGRDWQLSSYVEMAVRTAAARAFRESSLARMRAVSIRYFRIAEHVNPCPQCFPWQHQVIADEPDISGFPTLADAVAAGLFHPNCRCSLIPWIPEVDPVPAEQEWTEADQARYAATQRQRALEREIRKAKTAAAAALTPETRTAALKDVRRLQARMRAFLEEHDYLGRQSRREQPRLRMDRTGTKAWEPTGPNPDPNVYPI